MAFMAFYRLRLLYFSFAIYLIAILSLTLGKTLFTIGGLWKTGAHERRTIELVPFTDFVTSTTWFGPIFNLVGNIVLFFPLGFLLLLVLERRSFSGRRLAIVALCAFVFSFALEALQFFLQIGYSDSGDLICNMAGAVLGAWAAASLTRRGRTRIVQWSVYASAVMAVTIFCLLGIGPALLQILPEWLHFAPKNTSGR